MDDPKSGREDHSAARRTWRVRCFTIRTQPRGVSPRSMPHPSRPGDCHHFYHRPMSLSPSDLTTAERCRADALRMQSYVCQ